MKSRLKTQEHCWGVPLAAESPALLLSASIVRLGRSPGSNHKHGYKFDTDSLVSQPHTPRQHRKTTHYGNTTTPRQPNAAQKNTERGEQVAELK